MVVNDETLALDVIDELGPTGSYLGHEHTIRHCKEPYYSKLADKNPYASWADEGRDHDGSPRRQVMVDEILAKHKTEPLSGRSSGGHQGDRRARAEVDRRAKVNRSPRAQTTENPDCHAPESTLSCVRKIQ